MVIRQSTAIKFPNILISGPCPCEVLYDFPGPFELGRKAQAPLRKFLAKTREVPQNLGRPSNMIATLRSNKNKIVLSDTASLSQQQLGSVRAVIRVPYRVRIFCICRIAGRIVHTSWDDKNVIVWNIDTNELTAKIQLEESAPVQILLNSSGDRVIAWAMERAKDLLVFDTCSGALLFRITRPYGIECAACYQDAYYVLGLANGLIDVWNAKTAELVSTGHQTFQKSNTSVRRILLLK